MIFIFNKKYLKKKGKVKSKSLNYKLIKENLNNIIFLKKQLSKILIVGFLMKKIIKLAKYQL